MNCPHRIREVLAVLFVLVGFSVSAASAQTPVITSAPTTVAAGPDYPTDVLSNPWDFNDALDLSPFPDEFAGWTNSSTTARSVGRTAFLSSGNFTARTSGGGNVIPLLYRGGGPQSLTESTGHFDHKAIPTAGFGKLSLAMTLSASTVGQLVAYWYSGTYGHEQARGVAFSTPRAGTHIYTVDLVAGTWYDERGNLLGPTFVPAGSFTQIAWNGASLMRGFQLRATSDGGASVDVQVDWVRLTQRDGQTGVTTLPISFSGCQGRDYSIEVLAGSNWDVIHAATAGATSTTTANVNYGVLPPGSWQFRVVCYSTTRASGTPTASSPVTIAINQPPVVTVHNPDAVGGADFATDVLKNPWDMNALSDAPLIAGVVSPSIVSDGVTNSIQATATAAGDPAIVLLNGNGLVDTPRYRNVTFALTLDTPFGLDGNLGQGSVARILWERPAGTGNNLTISQDILVWPGRNVYTFDLAAFTIANEGLETSCIPSCQQSAWQATSNVRYFRIDPHEAPNVRFRLGATLLTAFDEVRVGTQFPLQYGFADSDTSGATYQARIYLDTDRDPASRTLIDTINTGLIPNTLLTYNFDPAGRGVTAGVYYVYVEVIETRAGVIDTRGSYSGGPLVVTTSGGGPLPPGPPVLSAVQINTNPVTVSWQPGFGGTPTNYTVVAGSAPGASNFGSFNMGTTTQISGAIPAGVRIYVRVVASNEVGSATSNEISFLLGGDPPGAPVLNSLILNGRTVTLSWRPPTTGGLATSYVLVARYNGSPNVIATFPNATTTATFTNVPPGDYVATVYAVNGAGAAGPESSGVRVVVQ